MAILILIMIVMPQGLWAGAVAGAGKVMPTKLTGCSAGCLDGLARFS